MPQNYGAVPAGGDDGNFDENQTYYLEEKRLSREQRLRQFFLVTLPILIGVLVLGGSAVYLLQHFDRLYPGGQGRKPEHSRAQPVKPDYNENEDTNTSTLAPTRNNKKASKTDTASCSAHSKCSALIGLCCPTEDGKFLDCCNR